jgi:SecD/SecF fusion protein
MEKRKGWQFYLIIAVIILTIYNIMPTVFYYAQPLKKAVDAPKAVQTAQLITQRVNDLEQDAISWINSFCKLLKISPANISINNNNPQDISISFAKKEDAQKFKKYMPKAGALRPFIPSQLYIPIGEDYDKTIIVKRQIPTGLDNKYFSFVAKKDPSGNITDTYKKITFDRASQLGLAIGGQSETASMLLAIKENPKAPFVEDFIYRIAQDVVNYSNIFKDKSPVLKRYFASFTQVNDSTGLVDNFLNAMQNQRMNMQMEKSQKSSEEILKNIERKEKLLIKAENIIKNNKASFENGANPFTYETIFSSLSKSQNATFSTAKNNPLIRSFSIDWANDKILLFLHDDLSQCKDKDAFEQLIINEIARINRLCDEKINYFGNSLTINLNDLSNSQSLLVLKLEELALKQVDQLKNYISQQWQTTHTELQRSAFPIVDYATYLKMPSQEQKLCLVLFTPILHSNQTPFGMHSNSIYIIAKGLNRILQKYQNFPNSEEAKTFFQDFGKLQNLLKQNGFMGYPGASLPITSDLAGDFVFEKTNYYQNILAATRENFQVHGSKKFATLEFSDYEQRLLTLNSIETKMHEDLLKWQDEYNAAQVSMRKNATLEVPKPTKSVFWDNQLLSFRKYFRGDERKILHWGLDMSGGKTVQLELRDQSNKVVAGEADLKQGVNELYNRVNKMGVSEVNIRTVGRNIVLDFPGSQGFSAAELIKASSMFFHVVNEKFTPNNPSLSSSVSRFLQEVWNEAVVTGKKDIENINIIAYRHLYGEGVDAESAQPKSEAAKALYENGLRLENPQEAQRSSIFNDTISKIAIFRGDSFTEWHNQTHPLLIVFNNYTLEGSSLTNIHAAYDPSKGNYLTFQVKNSLYTKEGKASPREDLSHWTAHFAREKIAATPLENYSHGHGWRMAVILNDFVISAPTLDSPLKDSAMISGSFSQREVNQLVADLKAGSLTFTPHILFEKNVSPELGIKDRNLGIAATISGLVLVVIAMISYYRFAGIIAALAVIFNLIIIWATLQNLQATLSLAGLAGIILTIGMAVDANVLVNERIKEEFAKSGRISSAIITGYKKAFSAILDSNITTIIAALILLNFDAGPIKGFAITLIIGIVSSMFSALFMTKYFFVKWSQNPNHTTLKMSNLVKATNFNFLGKAKYVYTSFVLIIAVGFATVYLERQSLFGIDFTGGYSINIEVSEQQNGNYRQLVEEAFTKEGLTQQDFQVRELTPSNNLRIVFGSIMDKKGHAFYQMPLQLNKKDSTYTYENNPRITWTVNALTKHGLVITPVSLNNLDANWTSISGQMSDSMRNNAIFGLLIALTCIVIYLTIRFEFKFGLSALLCLLHDVSITLGVMAILHAFKVSVQIDMNTIAALMTIVGYSLNDTIIIFDRIREFLKIERTISFKEAINHALNTTLARTFNTSMATFLALLPIVILGASTIFSFALVMIIGIIFGTLSSLFIASPLVVFFHNREVKKIEKKEKEITA